MRRESSSSQNRKAGHTLTHTHTHTHTQDDCYRPPKVRIAYVIKAVTVEGVSNRKKFRNVCRQPFWLATWSLLAVCLGAKQAWEGWNEVLSVPN